MSKVAIAGNASGTGTFTIAAPNSNTDRTLTLPDEAGTILTSSSSGLGKVLQVVSTTSISTTYINSTSFVDTGLSASITPSSASNKIAIFMGYYIGQDDADGNQAFFNLVRTISGSSTEIYLADQMSQDTSAGQVFAHCQVSYLDSPNTTSSVTYKSQGRTANASSDFRPRSASMILMEIAG